MTELAKLQVSKRLRAEDESTHRTMSHDWDCFLFNESSVASNCCAIAPFVLVFSVHIPYLGRAREAPRWGEKI